MNSSAAQHSGATHPMEPIMRLQDCFAVVGLEPATGAGARSEVLVDLVDYPWYFVHIVVWNSTRHSTGAELVNAGR